MILNFYNPSTGQRAKGKYWFSWTVLLFGFFPALFRSHWVGAIVMFLVALVTFGLSWFVFPFFYNKWHAKWLSDQGYLLVASDQQASLVESKWGGFDYTDDLDLLRAKKVAADGVKPPSRKVSVENDYGRRQENRNRQGDPDLDRVARAVRREPRFDDDHR